MTENREIAIEAKDVKKTFKIPHEKTTSLKQAALGLFREKKYSKLEVLKGISFKIYDGEFFGIVGRNGCGKSTLLKILAGIYTIDSGELKISGKISPFLELGVGFNPELTGRENIYLNGAILGLSKKEIDEKFQEMVEFSELQDFMDQKLKNYSSGMQVRLAFSVAIHAHAPIILLDEVLAVGDERFQRKCRDVFLTLKAEKRTIVFVTHDMDSVREYCDRAILISSGHVVIDGDPAKVAAEYSKSNLDNESTVLKNVNNEISISSVVLDGKEKNIILPFGVGFELSAKIKNSGDEKNANIHLAIVDGTGENVLFSMSADQKIYKLGKETKINFSIDSAFAPGDYKVILSLHDPKTGDSFYSNSCLTQFKIAKTTSADLSHNVHWG